MDTAIGLQPDGRFVVRIRRVEDDLGTRYVCAAIEKEDVAFLLLKDPDASLDGMVSSALRAGGFRCIRSRRSGTQVCTTRRGTFITYFPGSEPFEGLELLFDDFECARRCSSALAYVTPEEFAPCFGEMKARAREVLKKLA